MAILVSSGSKLDLPFLELMLHQAVHWRGVEDPALDQGPALAERQKLLEDWGREGDTAVIAEQASRPVGAAWYRFWTDGDHSYGYLSSEIPELAIGVVRHYRRQGLGRRLIDALLEEAARQAVGQVSLSVERDNPALSLYRAAGFRVAAVVGNAYTMVADTRRS